MVFNWFGRLLRWLVVAEIVSCVALRPINARASCDDEARQLDNLAADVALSVSGPSEIEFASPIQVTWHAGSKFPTASPVFAMIAVTGTFRVNVTEINKAEGEQFPPPGIIALPSGTRAPLGIKFGSNSTSRILIPLYQPGSRLSGSFALRLLTTGTQTVQSGLVSLTRCGERLIKSFQNQPILVTPSKPDIVIQDFYDTAAPRRIVLSNSGRYRLKVYTNRYQVFDTFTDVKLLDRAGYNPNFSPTERFVAASILDDAALQQQQEEGFEVIDLMSLEVIAKPTGPVIGWTHGDAFLIDGTGLWANISVWQALVSPVRASVIGFAHGTHFDRSWANDADVTLDLDNGVVFTRSEIVELASGLTRNSVSEGGVNNWSVAKQLAEDYAIKPISQKPGWYAREPIRFSHSLTRKHLVYGDGKSVSLAKIGVIGANRNLSFAVYKHRELPGDNAKPGASSVTPRNRSILGDWRTSAPPHGGDRFRGAIMVGDSPSDSSNKQQWVTALQAFGLSLGTPRLKETLPYSDYAEKDDRSNLTDKQERAKFDRIDARADKFIERLSRDVPVVGAMFQSADWAQNPWSCMKGDVGQAWRWEFDAKAVWVVHCLKHDGGASQSAYSTVFLLDGRNGDGQVTELTDSITPPPYTPPADTASQKGSMLADIYSNRHLVLTSRLYGKIATYDLAAVDFAPRSQDVVDTDRVDDAPLTVDGRHIVQINGDGQFFIHELATSRVILQGRQVDDEIIVFSKDGYYWSSYEGAHFVHLRFPGIAGLHSLKQFEPVLDRPEYIKGILDGSLTAPPQPRLDAPPEIRLSLVPSIGDQVQLLKINASSSSGLAQLYLYADGQRIVERKVEGRALDDTVAVPRQGKTWLTALAVDGRGLASSPQSVWAPGAKAASRTLRGLVIGINAYLDPNLVLQYARPDAERLADALKKNAGQYYESVNIQVLRDAEATSSAVLSVLRGVVADMTPADTLVFSFAGHGSDDDGKLYLVTANHRKGNPASNALAWSDVAVELSRSRGRVIVFLDACHAGRSGSESNSTNDAAAEALLTASRAPLLIFAASKGRQYSYEDKRWGGGLFTHAITQALWHNRSKYDQDGNGVIDVSELYRAAKEIVTKESKGRQSPWLVRRDLVGNFGLF